jgi:hypothetical protein
MSHAYWHGGPRLHAKLVSANAQTSELREFLAAAKVMTVEKIGDQRNSDYDYGVTLWLATIIFCCGTEEITDVEDLPSWTETIGDQFDHSGVRDRKSIPASIQKDLVEIFRI